LSLWRNRRPGMRLHTTFEWDEDKAKRNLKKHRVSFEDAARMLADDEGDIYHIEEFDVEIGST